MYVCRTNPGLLNLMYLYVVSPYTKAVRTYVRTYTALRRFSLMSAFIYFPGKFGIIIFGFSFENSDFFFLFVENTIAKFLISQKRYDMEYIEEILAFYVLYLYIVSLYTQPVRTYVRIQSCSCFPFSVM
jgi:hypothetical protein